MSALLHDLRFALRALRRGRLVTAVAVVSLAFAIGGNAAVFSLVDAFLFRPLPYPEPERVVFLSEREAHQPESATTLTTSLPTWADVTERGRTLERWAAVRYRTLSLRGPERAEPVPGAAVAGAFFDALGVRPVRGRLFGAEAAVEGGAALVVVSHEYGVERWGAAGDPLGEVLVLDGEPHEVVGVLPPGFDFLVPGTDLFVPLRENPRAGDRERRDILAFGRMQDGVGMEAVRAELRALSVELEAEHPGSRRGWTIDAVNFRYDIPDRQSRALFGLLQGATVFVLLIACANIVNLLLARGQERLREIAVRSALGAGRGRIVRQLLTESLLMAAAGGVLGVGLGWLGIQAIARSFVEVLPATWIPALDHRVLLFTAVVAGVAGLAFGLTPAIQTLRRGQAAALRDAAAGGRKGRRAVSRLLVVGELALAVVALGGGSVIVRSFLQARNADPGFETARLLTATVGGPALRGGDDGEVARFHRRLLEAVEGVGDVRAATLTDALPMGFVPVSDSFRVRDGRSDADAPAPRAVRVRVSPGWAEALGIDVLQGRFFDDGDAADRPAVAVLGRALAESAFEGGSPVGARVLVGDVEREVVGVVEDVRQSLIRTAGAASDHVVLVPAAQEPTGVVFLAARTTGDPRQATEALREAVRAVDPDATLSDVYSMDERLDLAFTGVRVFNAVLGGFGVLALLLACLGTYGVLSYTVGQRRREIGIRMAVGADGSSVVGLVARQGLAMALVGLVLGLLMTVPVVRVVEGLLAGFAEVDALATVPAVALALLAMAVLATWLPARRAAGTDPVRALRAE